MFSIYNTYTGVTHPVARNKVYDMLPMKGLKDKEA